MLSPNSFGSNNVNRELTLAERNDKTIIPIFYKSAEIPNSMAYQLAGLQQLDFSTGDYSENFQILLNTLVRLGFTPRDPEEVVEGTAKIPKKTQKSDKPLSKIPGWGWIGGGVVILLFLILGISNLFGSSKPEPTLSPTIQVLVAVENLPTATEILFPTETLEPTEIAVITEEIVLPTDTPMPDTATVTETPTSTPYPPQITDAIGVEMVFVPAGEFIMGSNAHEPNAFPAHTVETGAYYIDKFEVTNSSYAKCVKEGACEPPRSLSSKTRPAYYGNSEFGFYPVIWVNWDAAVTFCEWRGGRLPTETEWEKAARGDDARTYPWGDEIGTECVEANYWKFSGCGDTRGIGTTIGESPYGAFEMAGNVWEWVQDNIILYPGGNSGAISRSEIGNKVLRGGSWIESDGKILTTYRFSAPADSDDNDIGFRCVLDVPLP